MAREEVKVITNIDSDRKRQYSNINQMYKKYGNEYKNKVENKQTYDIDILLKRIEEKKKRAKYKGNT